MSKIYQAKAMSFSRLGIQHDWKDAIFGVHCHVAPGCAETLVMTGGITNHHLVAYSLSNVSVKNYQNRFMCVDVSVQHQCRFFETVCIILVSSHQTIRLSVAPPGIFI